MDPMLISQIADKFNQRKLNIFVADPSKEYKVSIFVRLVDFPNCNDTGVDENLLHFQNINL